MNIRHGILSIIFYMAEMPRNLCKLLWHTLFAFALYTFLLGITVAAWLTFAAGFIATGVFLVNHPLAVITIVEAGTVGIVAAITVIGLTVKYIKERWRAKRVATEWWRDAAGNNVIYPEPHTLTVLYRAFKDKFCPTIEWHKDD